MIDIKLTFEKETGLDVMDPVSRQNLIRVENGAIPLAPQIEKRAWIRLRVALRGARRFSLGKHLGTSGIHI
jgi:hypothetical protein